MEAILELLASHAGPWAFLLLVSCGLGLPPWSEEIVLLASGHFVAQGDLRYWAAAAWCAAGILGGDTLLWLAGRFLGWRLTRWRPFHRSMSPRRIARFERQFRRNSDKAVFAARFLPGFRVAAYFTAGHTGMPWWRFAALDAAGAALTVPLSIWVGHLFSSNLDAALSLIHRFQVPLGLTALLLIVVALRRGMRRRQARYRQLLDLRRRLGRHLGARKGARDRHAGGNGGPDEDGGQR